MLVTLFPNKKKNLGMDGNWKWTDGSKSIYTNWGSNAEGNDGKRFDCVYMEADQGLWKDAPCNKKQPFLCKRKNEGKIFIIDFSGGSDFCLSRYGIQNFFTISSIVASASLLLLLIVLYCFSLSKRLEKFET